MQDVTPREPTPLRWLTEEEFEAMDFRLEFLLPDGVASLLGEALPPARLDEYLVSRMARLLNSSPQSALLHPDGYPVWMKHQGPQPANGMRMVLHYDRGMSESRLPDALRDEAHGYELVMLANSVRILDRNGAPVRFLKDRLGRCARDQ